MTACNFDLLFTFVMAGWKSAANDTRIFLDAIRRQSINFPKPPLGIKNFYKLNMYEGYYLYTSYIFFLLLGKYYLVDVGYPLRKWYLPPYKG